MLYGAIYNSRIIQFVHLRCTIQSFLVYSQMCVAITILEYFHILKKKPVHLLAISSQPSSLQTIRNH